MSRGYSATQDPMRELKYSGFQIGHNLCENDKQTLYDYI